MIACRTGSDSVESLELRLLLEGIFDRYGLDLRDYASVERRVRRFLSEEKLGTISALQERVFRDLDCLERLLKALFVRVTSMFRDPRFYLALRSEVLPLLRTYPFVRIWHAGCSTGEEVYSMAILLCEEGIYDRCRIYGTDINGSALEEARKGIFPLSHMQENTSHYILAGGKESFSQYYTAHYDHAVIRSDLKKNLVFAQHNLTTDASFNEFHLILCRNVLIYLNQSAQARVHRLLYGSLATLGFLGLGSKESIKFTPHEDRYRQVGQGEKLFRKTG